MITELLKSKQKVKDKKLSDTEITLVVNGLFATLPEGLAYPLSQKIKQKLKY